MLDNTFSRLIIIILLALISINLFILDLKVFSSVGPIQLSDIVSVVTPLPSKIPVENPANQFCPNSCLSLIQEATRSSSSALGTPQQTTTTAYQQTNRQPRESYVPLGSGSTSKSDWDDITATETIIDPGSYGTIKEAYFIASLKNSTSNGQVDAQVYNVTDKHPVWGSHVIMNGPSAQTISSQKITLDNGTKLYRVQLKSSMSYPVSLENAKIRIVAE